MCCMERVDENFIQWLVESIYPLSFLTNKNRCPHYRIGSTIISNERMFELELSTCKDVESEEFHQYHYLKGLVDKVIWSSQAKVESLIEASYEISQS